MRRLIGIFFFASLFSIPPSYGQYGLGGPSDGLTATGSVEIKVRPEFLQMTIQVEGRSSELPQAADELKRRIEVAQKKLKQLGATPASVKIAKPQIAGSGSPQEAQRMQAMIEQYGGGRRGQQMLEETKSVSVTQSITARWPLSGDDDLERLIAGKMLTKKIRKADVASNADDQPVSAAQEELAVEMDAMMDEYGYGEEKTKPGEPEFQFVARLSNEQYKSAIASAFEKAKRRIKTVADATEIFVSDPLPISSSIGSEEINEYYARGSSNQPQEDAQSGDYELFASNPNQATCAVTVTAIGKHK